MNQILYKSVLSFDKPKKNNENKKYIIIFVIAVLIIIIAICFYIYLKYRLFENEKKSQQLVSNYSIMTLYLNSVDDYSIDNLKFNQSKNKNQNQNQLQNQEKIDFNPFVIGLIQIDKIGLTYPILSTTSPDLLKISPCRFAGPMPNEIGNLCIAGHNYVDNKQFSKINLLNIDDTIKIYNLDGISLTYKIYSKNEISPTDLSCLDQKTNNKRHITLITCNNVTGKRLCIKAQEIK